MASYSDIKNGQYGDVGAGQGQQDTGMYQGQSAQEQQLLNFQQFLAQKMARNPELEAALARDPRMLGGQGIQRDYMMDQIRNGAPGDNLLANASRMAQIDNVRDMNEDADMEMENAYAADQYGGRLEKDPFTIADRMAYEAQTADQANMDRGLPSGRDQAFDNTPKNALEMYLRSIMGGR
jgi:hypothetical protein